MNLNEADLVRRAKAGDQSAFEALFRQYQSLMYRVALHFTSSPETAADLTQDAFVRAWEQLPRLREDAAFGGWLRSILVNLTRDALRRRRPEDHIEDDPRGAEGVVDPGSSPEESAAQSEHEEAVRRAVMSLPEHQRTVVMMHHLEGKAIEDIADVLGLKKGTVLSRLSRGRALLKRKLVGHLGEP